MKKLNVHEMRAVDGGYEYIYYKTKCGGLQHIKSNAWGLAKLYAHAKFCSYCTDMKKRKGSFLDFCC